VKLTKIQCHGRLVSSEHQGQATDPRFGRNGGYPRPSARIHLNTSTGVLTVEPVAYGPRGNDEWARRGNQVIAAWPSDQWSTVARHDRRHA
jgi:hypothetical protein